MALQSTASVFVALAEKCAAWKPTVHQPNGTSLRFLTLAQFIHFSISLFWCSCVFYVHVDTEGAKGIMVWWNNKEKAHWSVSSLQLHIPCEPWLREKMAHVAPRALLIGMV